MMHKTRWIEAVTDRQGLQRWEVRKAHQDEIDRLIKSMNDLLALEFRPGDWEGFNA